jgi:hypothetical protein
MGLSCLEPGGKRQVDLRLDHLLAVRDGERQVYEPGPSAFARVRLHADASPVQVEVMAVEANQFGYAETTECHQADHSCVADAGRSSQVEASKHPLQV